MQQWRLIDSGSSDAALNMALDEAIARAVRSSEQPPTLRIYQWSRQSISIGAFQKTSDISIEYCIRNNIPIVRRPTGGRAVLHGDELTYSISAPNEGHFSKGLFNTYAAIGSAFVLAFQYCGLNAETRATKNSGANLTRSPVCFNASSLGEVCVGKIKITGAAQKRWDNAFLQQGSIPLSIDYDTARGVFPCCSNDCSALHGLKEWLPHINRRFLAENIVRALKEVFSINLRPAGPSDPEIAYADHLAQTKYLSSQHTFRTGHQ
ncbi:MAG: lipoate--protein ligase family protein [Dissulfurispiraceae bacterium]|jgi:lipoate-protein ligase A|nr:lipoate--protein ligase family protein [Dissulfurispiraceae bacterium]